MEIPIELARPNTFSNRVLIIDGQGRSGKNLISVLLSSFESVEKMQLHSQLDYIPRYFSLGKMSFDAAKVSLLTELDEKYFYSSISRDANLRPSDYSSIWKQARSFTYFLRLFRSESKAVRQILEHPRIFQDMTHDALQFAPFWFSVLGERLNLIHVLRDPLQNVYEQSKRHFGSRIGKDPREFQLTFGHGESVVPLMAQGNEEKYLGANDTERIILQVHAMLQKNISGYMALTSEEKLKVYFVDFEEFVVSPLQVLMDLERLVGRPPSRTVKRIMRRERVPRKSLGYDPLARLEDVRSKISDEFRELLDDLLEEYSRFQAIASSGNESFRSRSAST
jgi:hypothetical protein